MDQSNVYEQCDLYCLLYCKKQQQQPTSGPIPDWLNEHLRSGFGYRFCHFIRLSQEEFKTSLKSPGLQNWVNM